MGYKQMKHTNSIEEYYSKGHLQNYGLDNILLHRIKQYYEHFSGINQHPSLLYDDIIPFEKKELKLRQERTSCLKKINAQAYEIYSKLEEEDNIRLSPEVISGFMETNDIEEIQKNWFWGPKLNNNYKILTLKKEYLSKSHFYESELKQLINEYENRKKFSWEKWISLCEEEILKLVDTKFNNQSKLTETESNIIYLFYTYRQVSLTKTQKYKIIALLKETEPKVQSSSTNNAVLIELKEGQAGITFKTIFSEYLSTAHWINIKDPFIRADYQVENVKKLLSLVKKPSECRVHLITTYDDPRNGDHTEEVVQQKLNKLKESLQSNGFSFSFEFALKIHDRYIVTEKWRINSGRGLDLFYYEDNQMLCRGSDNITIFTEE